ncbi:hypothetical protein GF354_01930 [Candidatus Peregrinibacteria bacterium]|nr:hypothetical protein [Candidatus Peregrinibacteria bacterium]
MANKRIHNKKTGTYYKIRQKTTKNGKKGQIMGKFRTTPQVKTHLRRSIGDVVRKLAHE